MISNPFDSIDMSLLDEFDNEDDLHSYLVSKYGLDVAKSIEFVLASKDYKNNKNPT